MKHLLSKICFLLFIGACHPTDQPSGIYLWEYEIDGVKKMNILEFPEPNIIVDSYGEYSYRHIFQSCYEIQIEPESIPFWFENDQIFFNSFADFDTVAYSRGQGSQWLFHPSSIRNASIDLPSYNAITPEKELYQQVLYCFQKDNEFLINFNDSTVALSEFQDLFEPLYLRLIDEYIAYNPPILLAMDKGVPIDVLHRLKMDLCQAGASSLIYALKHDVYTETKGLRFKIQIPGENPPCYSVTQNEIDAPVSFDFEGTYSDIFSCLNGQYLLNGNPIKSSVMDSISRALIRNRTTMGIYAYPGSDYQDYIQLIGTLYSNTLNLRYEYIDSISYSNYEDSTAHYRAAQNRFPFTTFEVNKEQFTETLDAL